MNAKPAPFPIALTLVFALGVSACEHPRCADLSDLPASDSVLVLGDSVFDFHADTCSDVGDHISFALGEQVEDRAVGGTRLINPGEEDISSSYVEGAWEWVILDGGANDLNERCSCDCGPEVLDDLIDENLVDGAMPELVARATDDGAQVVLFGYYRAVEGSEFDACGDELDILSARYAQLAEASELVHFVEGRDVMSPESDPRAYAEDGIHPSAEGAELIAEAILSVLEAD